MRRLHHSVIGEYVFLVSFLVQLCFNRMAQLRANYERERPFRHEPRVSAAYPSSNHPDKFFVTVFEKDPGISSMNIDTMLCGASTSTKASRAAPPPWPHVVHILRARVQYSRIVFGNRVPVPGQTSGSHHVMGDRYPGHRIPFPLTERLASYIGEFGCVLNPVEFSRLCCRSICVYNIHCLANFGHIYNVATQN
jgi:hypothetical protein